MKLARESESLTAAADMQHAARDSTRHETFIHTDPHRPRDQLADHVTTIRRSIYRDSRRMPRPN